MRTQRGGIKMRGLLGHENHVHIMRGKGEDMMLHIGKAI